MKKCFRIAATVLAFFAAVSVSAQTRKVDVWDFGGVEEKNAVNHIKISDLDNLSGLAADGKFEAGEYTFGDLTLKTDKNDRAYYNGSKNYGTQGYSSFEFSDGYISDGIYYCNGKGGEARRYLLLKNVKAGDIVTFYGRASNGSEDKIHFASVNESGEKNGIQDESAWLNGESRRWSYIAVSDGSYKVYCEATSAKPVYYRITRTPGVNVNGSIKGLPSKGELKFVVSETKQQLPAKISGGSYTTRLPAGFTFTAVLEGVKGFGISADTKQISISQDAQASLKKDLAASEMKTYIVDGKISGFAKDFSSSSAKLVMTPPANSLYLPIEIEIQNTNGEFSFKGELEPAVQYAVSLEGANDYTVAKDTVFEGTAAFTKDIQVELKPVYDVNGKFIGDTSIMPSSISFKNLEDGYTYTGAAANGIYGTKLRDGNYEVLCETEKTSTMNHISVSGSNVTKDILMSAKDKTVNQIPLKKDIYVGGKKQDYSSVKQAVKAAHAMAPKSEADRITIHIAPGIYRDQVIIDTPYITLKNDTPAQEVKLTWYYGIGYNYYSADLNGYYDEERAYDKFEKKSVAKWGVATYVKKDAKFLRKIRCKEEKEN